MSESSTGPLARLVRRLSVEPLDADVFLGRSGKGEGALFGGMVAAQAVMAAGHTVGTDRALHSLHAYFLRPGRHAVPIRFMVTRIRDGRTFSTRNVVAHQAGEAIFTMAANFTIRETGIAHQDPMPAAPPPDSLPDWEDVRLSFLGPDAVRRPDGPVEVRVCDPDSAAPHVTQAARRRVWLRLRGTLPDDPLLHAAALVYASDRTLLRTAARPHGLTWRLRVGASLDHAVWLHHPARFDDWILFVAESPAAHAARALLLGAMYRRDGTRIASVAQEGLLRT